MKNMQTIQIAIFSLFALSCSKKNDIIDPVAVTRDPADLVITNMTETSVSFRWKNGSIISTNDTTSKNSVEESSDGVHYTVAVTVPFAVTYATITGVFLTTEKYYFRVKTSDGSPTPLYSKSISQTLLFPEPTDLTLISQTTTQISLRWVDNSSFETGFEIEWSKNNSDYTLLKSVSANATNTVVAAPFDSSTTYSFRVRAVSAFNRSLYSNTLWYTIASSQDMMPVAGGTFSMGSAVGVGDSDEEPLHTVTLSNFSISKAEIQSGIWDSVSQWGKQHAYTDMPDGERSLSNSVRHYSEANGNWYDIVKWCNARSEKEGLTPVYYTSLAFNSANIYRTGEIDLQNTMVNWGANGYRLPTEAEWEYAALGGMKCSIWQWCWDWYGPYGVAAQTDPRGPISGNLRIIKGVSTGDYGIFRPANREFNLPGVRNFIGVVGFRCVKSI